MSNRNKMHYEHPPIAEALIDIKVAYATDFELSKAENLYEVVKESLPTKNVRNGVMININPEGSTVTEGSLDGLILASADGKKVLQITREGFTFSLLNGYDTWQSFLDEAMNYWGLFKEKLEPITVRRVGVRYINKILLPVNTQDLSEYFNIRITLGDIEGKPKEQFMRVVLQREPNTCILTQALDPSLVSDDKQGFIIDIDAFNEENYGTTEQDKLLSVLEDLHVLKNDIFKKSITEKTERMFE